MKNSKDSPNDQCFSPLGKLRLIRAVIRAPGLTEINKLLLIDIIDYSNKKGQCWPSVPTMARHAGIRERAARRNLAVLDKSGLIVRDEKHGRNHTNLYTIKAEAIRNLPAENRSLGTGFSDGKPIPGDTENRSLGDTENRSLGDTKTGTQGPPKQFIESVHHQSAKKEAPRKARSVVGTPGTQSKKTSSKSDDDKAGSQPDPATQQPASYEKPREELLRRLTERHGALHDVERIAGLILADLENGNVLLNDFLTLDDKATLSPWKLTNPTGHYRKLVRELVRTAKAGHYLDIGEMVRNMEEQGKYEHPCTCDPNGKLPDGGYCSCKVGQFAKQVAEAAPRNDAIGGSIQ